MAESDVDVVGVVHGSVSVVIRNVDVTHHMVSVLVTGVW